MKKTLIITVLVAIHFTVFGQEIIRAYDSIPFCDTSIIRAKTNDSLIMYNSDNNYSIFMLVTSGSVSAPILRIEPYYVNDFEIFGNKVYFCGYKIENETKKAIFGSFIISTFPNCSVLCYELDTCTELKKLDMYQSGEEPAYDIHMVMTGSTGTRSNAIVDKVIFSTFPYMYIPCDVYFSNEENISFDDVAVTKDYVVVSSRNKIQGLPFIDFYHFTKPTIPGINIFFSPIYHFQFGNLVAETPVFIEHEYDNRYAAVYKLRGFPRMIMLRLIAPSSIMNSLELSDVNSEIHVPMDIKYNKITSVYDILARSGNELLPLMQIYHVTQGMIHNYVSFGEGTKYSNNYLWSIDPLKTSNFFVASGAKGWGPRMFRYTDNLWKTCPERFSYSFNRWLPEGSPQETREEYYSYKLQSKKIETQKNYIWFPTLCHE